MAKKNVVEGNALTTIDNWSPLPGIGEIFDRGLVAGAKSDGGGLAPMISTEDGPAGIMRDGAVNIGDTLDAVILGVAVEHQLYPSRYVKGQFSPPICFYVGPDEKRAAPHESSPDKQAESCAKCVKNTFGSAGGNSKAKACRQGRRLLILPLGDNDTVEDAPLRRLRVPPTSIKYISAYVDEVHARGFELPSIVTRIKITPDAKVKFEMTFKPHRPLRTVEELRAVARKAEIGKGELFQLPQLGDGSATPSLAGVAQQGKAPGRRQVVKR